MTNFSMSTTYGPVKKLRLFQNSYKMELEVILVDYLQSTDRFFEDDDDDDEDESTDNNGTMYLGGSN